MTLIQSETKKIYIWVDMPEPLCFTANTSGSTVQLTKYWNPIEATFETSTDGSTWTTYTIWDTITLSNIWDKVYWRNTSETDIGIGSNGYRYKFVMTWSIAASWDVTTLLNKNWTLTASSWCFRDLFYQCTALTTSPRIPVTTIVGNQSFREMFSWCTWLTSIPALYSLDIRSGCYKYMFEDCPQILISDTQTETCPTPYRLPIEWTGETDSPEATMWMFDNKWRPAINTTYYVNCDVVY